MSILNLPTEMINHILSFLDVKDHNRFSLTRKDYYEAFSITKIECREGTRSHDDFVGCYMVLRSYNDDCVLRGVVGLNMVEYAGTTRHVKDLTIRPRYKFIHGDTIQYVPGSLTGEGLRYLVKLDIEQYPCNCTISDVRFERLVTLRAYRCSIIRCRFDVLENLKLVSSQFLSEMPNTIKTLNVHRCQFSDDCVKRLLVNLMDITSTAHDFIRYAPNVKKADVRETELYNLPESLEYLRLVDVKVQGEKFYLPNLRYLGIERLPFRHINEMYPHIVAPKLSKLTIRNAEITALDCPPVLDVCNVNHMRRNIDINSVVLMTDHAVDPKKFPSMRALYFSGSPEDLGDFVYELDMVYICYVTTKTSMNINARVLVTMRIDKDVDLRKMSRLKLLIAPTKYAAVVPAPIEFREFNYMRHKVGFIDLFKELFPDPQ